MKTTNTLTSLSILDLIESYKSGIQTPETVVKDIIRQSEEDKDYNIWITPPSMEWIKPYLERLQKMDQAHSPLWGIPFAIKDNIDVAGLPTTAGCAEFSYIPTVHATVVQRLIDAGAIPVGKTNLDQFATGLVGTRSPYGETKNAFKSELISGGSSSGSAVCVARGLATFALGTDTAGSGRVPASLNRLVGYKPSLGAWPVKGVVPACASLDCVTVFTNHFVDAQLVDETVRGFDINDPWSKEIERKLNALPEKILLLKETPLFFGPFSNEYQNAWEKTISQIKELGLSIEYIDGNYLSEAAAILYDGPWVAERWADLDTFITENEGVTFPVTETILRSGNNEKYNAASVFKAMHKLQAYKQKAHQQLKDGVLIMPTCGGTWTRDEVRERPIETNSKLGLYTNHCNLLDLCAVAIPANDASADLPFGVTLFSGNHNEHLISGLADLILNGKYPPSNKKESTLVAVCGLHMRGYPLEKQMIQHEAVFVCKANTAQKYRLIKLATAPAKPGLFRASEGEVGASIEVELWEMPLDRFGEFTAGIPAPLGIGKIELEDGTLVSGFLCEASAANNAEDITSFRCWRAACHA